MRTFEQQARDLVSWGLGLGLLSYPPQVTEAIQAGEVSFPIKPHEDDRACRRIAQLGKRKHEARKSPAEVKRLRKLVLRGYTAGQRRRQIAEALGLSIAEVTRLANS